MVGYGGIVEFFTILWTIVGNRHGGRFETKRTNDYDNEIAVKVKEAVNTKIEKQILDVHSISKDNGD